MSLKAAIAKYLADHALSQAAFARQTGLSESTISYLLSAGRGPGPEVFRALRKIPELKEAVLAEIDRMLWGV